MTLGFYFDVNKCSGCRTCHMACKERHNFNIGSILRKVSSFEVGTYPNVTGFRYSSSCYHCENPACMPVCPKSAIFRATDGTVLLETSMCIGCRLCEQACPYNALQFVADQNVMAKCDSCISLRMKGENPVCVDACNMRCLDFGDLQTLTQTHGPDLVQELPITPPANLTSPRVLIKPKPSSLSTNARKVEI